MQNYLDAIHHTVRLGKIYRSNRRNKNGALDQNHGGNQEAYDIGEAALYVVEKTACR
jgi:hypothetical protein